MAVQQFCQVDTIKTVYFSSQTYRKCQTLKLKVDFTFYIWKFLMVKKSFCFSSKISFFCFRLGSDRYDIHLHMERPLLVRDLMEELEKKARVTLENQQILYRGKN